MGVLADRRGSGLGHRGYTQHLPGRGVVNHLTATLAFENAAGRRDAGADKRHVL